MTLQVVRSLERKSLIEREVDATDTCARRQRVTRRGAQLAPQAVTVVEQVDAQFFGDVPSTKRFASSADSSCRPRPHADLVLFDRQ